MYFKTEIQVMMITDLPLQQIDIAGGRLVSVLKTEVETNTALPLLFDSGAFGIYADGIWIAHAFAALGVASITYTRAGLYGSDPVPDGIIPDPFFHAEDMARILDALRIDRPVILAGHSMAGLRLRAFATLYPQRVTGLVLIDAVTPAQLSMTVRREVVRMGCRMMSACSQTAETGFGKNVMRLYPNNIKLSGLAREDKLSSLCNAEHLRATRAEMLASTTPQLLPRLSSDLTVPSVGIIATIVARGTRQAGYPTLHIPRTGHAEILRPEPSRMIAEFAYSHLCAGRDIAAATRLANVG